MKKLAKLAVNCLLILGGLSFFSDSQSITPNIVGMVCILGLIYFNGLFVTEKQ